MPSYDLKCEKCDHQFSVFCSISAKDQQKCPECGSEKITQRFTTVNIAAVKTVITLLLGDLVLALLEQVVR